MRSSTRLAVANLNVLRDQVTSFCSFEQTMLLKHLYPVVLISGACISVIAKLELRGSFGVGTEAVLFENGDEVAVLGEAGLNRSFYL